MGIPSYVQGHHRMSMTEFVESLNREGYLTVSQAAQRLGISENTLRRAEAKGWVVPTWRSWGDRQPMRVYAEADLARIRVKMVDAGFRFKDDETFTTYQVAEQLGVAQSTLRRWERIGRIPKVARDSAGRRVYRAEDVEFIRHSHSICRPTS